MINLLITVFKILPRSYTMSNNLEISKNITMRINNVELLNFVILKLIWYPSCIYDGRFRDIILRMTSQYKILKFPMRRKSENLFLGNFKTRRSDCFTSDYLSEKNAIIMWKPLFLVSPSLLEEYPPIVPASSTCGKREWSNFIGYCVLEGRCLWYIISLVRSGLPLSDRSDRNKTSFSSRGRMEAPG